MSTKRKADAIVKPKLDKLMRAVMLEGMGKIMRRTPVDTGRARSNWNTSVNKPDLSTNQASTVKDVPLKQIEGGNTIRKIAFSRGQVGYLANGLPYIVPLEEGHSSQAPNGMVRLTMQELRQWLKRRPRG